MHGIYIYYIFFHGHFYDLDLGAWSQWLGRGKKLSFGLSTTKQAIKIKLAIMVGHDKFYRYFSLNLSVPIVLNYGHTSVSCKTYVQSLT